MSKQAGTKRILIARAQLQTMGESLASMPSMSIFAALSVWDSADECTERLVGGDIMVRDAAQLMRDAM